MDDQQSADAELVADADNAPETDASAEAEEGQTPEQLFDEDGNPIEPEDDTEEVDYEGKQYKLPKELKEALLRQADYTRKTQEVAQQRQAFEAERQQHVFHMQLRQQAVDARAEAIAVSQQLQQFDAVNWQALSEQDPAQAQRLWIQREQTKERLAQAGAKVTQAEQQALQLQHQSIAKQLQEGEQVLARDIKGWSPETAEKIRNYGRAQGLSEVELNGIADARVVKMLHKAMLYDQLAAKASQPKPKPAQVAQPAVKPVSAVKGKGAGHPTGYHKQMSDEAFSAWFNRKRGRA